MTRDEYIHSVLSQIEDKSARAEIEAELNAHLDDRIEYYTNAGYSEEYALSQTLGRMGDGEKTGCQLDGLNKHPCQRMAVVLLMILLAAEILFDYFYNITVETIFTTEEHIAPHLALEISSVISEYLIVFSILLCVFYSLKRSKRLPVGAACFAWGYLFWERAVRAKAVSGIAASAVYLATGSWHSLIIVTYYHPRTFVKVLSVMLYALLLLVIAASLIHIFKTRERIISRKQKKAKSCFLALVAISGMIILLFGMATAISYGESKQNNQPFGIGYLDYSEEDAGTADLLLVE